MIVNITGDSFDHLIIPCTSIMKILASKRLLGKKGNIQTTVVGTYMWSKKWSQPFSGSEGQSTGLEFLNHSGS